MILAALALGTWGIVAAAGCLVLHRARQVAPPQPQAEPVNWLPFLPPVPTQRQIDEIWLDVWPTELQQEQVDRLFDELIAIEGLQ